MKREELQKMAHQNILAAIDVFSMLRRLL